MQDLNKRKFQESWKKLAYVEIKNLTVKNIIDIIRIKKVINIKFINSKIMNQLSYRVSNKKISTLGFKSSNTIKKEIFETLKIFKFKNIDR